MSREQGTSPEIFIQRVRLVLLIDQAARAVAPADQERVTLLVADWYLQTSPVIDRSFESYLRQIGATPPLAAELRQVLKLVQRQLGAKPAPAESAAAWRLLPSLRHYQQLPPILRRLVTMSPDAPATASTLLSPLILSLALEQSVMLIKRNLDWWVTLPLVFDQYLLTELNRQGWQALAPTILAILAAEYVMWRSQATAAAEAQVTSRTLSTFLHRGLGVSPGWAAAIQRLMGKTGKLEYLALIPLAVLHNWPFLSVLMINELMAAALVLPDAVLNYSLALGGRFNRRRGNR